MQQPIACAVRNTTTGTTSFVTLHFNEPAQQQIATAFRDAQHTVVEEYVTDRVVINAARDDYPLVLIVARTRPFIGKEGGHRSPLQLLGLDWPDKEEVRARPVYWETDYDRWEDVSRHWRGKTFRYILITDCVGKDMCVRLRKYLFRHFLAVGGAMISPAVTRDVIDTKFVSIYKFFKPLRVVRERGAVVYEKLTKSTEPL